MLRLEKKHPLAIRWFHWINLPILFLMIWSGLLIYWANDVYRVGIGRHTLIHFFPDFFYDKFNLSYNLAAGMAWHFFFMWFFAVNGVLYVLYNLISGEWRFIVPGKSSLREALQVVLHDLHLRGSAPPRRKFNGAQQFAYTSIVLAGIGSLVTGLAIYKPVQLGWLDALLGGYQAARFEHFWLMMGYTPFLFVHVTQVIRAGWNNFRSMITGMEIVPAEPREMEGEAAEHA